MMEAAAYAAGDGPAVGFLAEAAFLLRTGMAYKDYLETPSDMIESMMLILNSEADVQRHAAERNG